MKLRTVSRQRRKKGTKELERMNRRWLHWNLKLNQNLSALQIGKGKLRRKLQRWLFFSWFVRLLKLESIRNYTVWVAASNVYCFTYYLWWYLGGWLVAVGSINLEGRKKKTGDSSSTWLAKPVGFCHPVSPFYCFSFRIADILSAYLWTTQACWFMLPSWCGRRCWQKKTRGNLCPVWASLRDGTSLARRGVWFPKKTLLVDKAADITKSFSRHTWMASIVPSKKLTKRVWPL